MRTTYYKRPMSFRTALSFFIFALLTLSALYQCGKEQGYDEGYAQATAEIYTALKEQAIEGKDFYIKGMPAIKFMPRKDGAIKYTFAGAGSDNWSRY